MADYKFFCVASEGATSDGRDITRADIVALAETYDFATRAARVNVEHIKGIDPTGQFGSYGDVLALKTGNVVVKVAGKDQTRLGLFAQIKPLDNLKALNQAGQKLYSSIEIQPNFANTGKPYLMGVAVTDNPAALGTEILQFCAGKGADNPLAARKVDPANLFTAAHPVEFDFTEGAAPPLGLTPDAGGIMAFVKQLLNFTSQQPAPAITAPAPADPAPTPAPAAPAAFVTDPTVAALFTAMAGQIENGQAQLAALTQRHAQSEASLAQLRAQLENEPARHFGHRPPATGAENVERADC